MEHLKIEQNNNVEIVSSNIVQKLYNTALATTDASLSGNLQVDYCYRKPVEYLRNRFEDLNINVTGGWLVDFGDDEMPKALASLLGYSNNFITEDLANKIAMFSAEADGNNYWYQGTNLSSTSSALLENDKITFMNFQPLPRLKNLLLVDRVHCPLLEVMNTGNLESIGVCSEEFTTYSNYRSIFRNRLVTPTVVNACPNMHTLICPSVKLFGPACIYGCDSLIDVYVPKCKWIGRYLTRNNNNLSLFYLEDIIAIPSDFFDDDNSNYSTVNMVINRDIQNSSELPTLYKTGSVTSPDSSMHPNIPNISGTNGFEETATFTQASESDINIGSRYWGHCKIYVPDSSVEIYKLTSPYTKLADNIYPISELSLQYKDMIQNNIGVLL